MPASDACTGLAATITAKLCHGEHLGTGRCCFGWVAVLFCHLFPAPYRPSVYVTQLHHTEKYNGVPWGLFLGPVELEKVGAKEELDMLVQKLGTGDIKAFKVPE